MNTNDSGGTPLRFLAAATGFAALVVGFLYSLGAVLIAGELRPTHVATRDALPLIPLTQMLARGMSVLLASFGLAVLFALVLVGGALLGLVAERLFRKIVDSIGGIQEDLDLLQKRAESIEAGDEATAKGREEVLAELARMRSQVPPSPPRFSRWQTVFILSCAALTGVILLVAGPPTLIPTALVVPLCMWLVTRGHLHMSVGFVLFWIAFWLGALLTAFYYPQRLATVTIRMDSQRHSGRLIAQTPDAVYMSEGRGTITVVPVGTAVGPIVIHSARSRQAPSNYRIAWNAIF